MMRIMKPNILFVDDKPDGLDSQVSEELEEHADTSVVHPNDLDLSALEAADLVLVDYKLEDWPERDEQVVSLRPETGLALAVLLRGAGRSGSERKVDSICTAYGTSPAKSGAGYRPQQLSTYWGDSTTWNGHFKSRNRVAITRWSFLRVLFSNFQGNGR